MFAPQSMNLKRKRYRYLIYLLPAVYVFSFLLSPYFHHHPDELFHNDQHKFHSHLLENPQDDHSSEETHSHNLDESNKHHFHSVKLSSSTTIITKRTPDFIMSVVVDLPLEIQLTTYHNYTLEKKPKNSIQQDRYIQTAANVSPPLV